MSVLVSDPDFVLHVGDVLDELATLPDGSVDCVVTSPPYWGLRDYGADGQLGLEPTPDAYIASMVAVFREVHRVLADHGTCWVNIGDSYNANQGAGFNGQKRQDHANRNTVMPRPPGLKPKDLVGIPWKLAFALQADGWYLRADIIWAKPNPMPESVTDRPTKSHEYVFLLSKRPRYWFDQEAVREPHKVGEAIQRDVAVGIRGRQEGSPYRAGTVAASNGSNLGLPPGGRNVRSVWEISTQPYAEAHFATYPEELVRRCLLAGCPERVCVSCGRPSERIVSATSPDGRTAVMVGGKAYDENGEPLMGDNMIDHGVRGSWNSGGAVLKRDTVGWSDCGHDTWRVGTVLDPFLGSGTSALVARKHGRRCVGIELNPEYAELAVRRNAQQTIWTTA